MRHVLLVLSLIALALPQGMLRSQNRDIATISRDVLSGDIFHPERRPSFNKPIPASATFFSIDPVVFDRVSLANHPTLVVDNVQLNSRQQGTLALTRFDVLKPDAQVLAATPQGNRVVERPRALFYRGSVREIPGSFVYLALFRDYCSGYIEIPSDTDGIRRYTIAPLSLRDGKQATMVIYDEFDALLRNSMLDGDGHWGCSAEDLPEYQPAVDQAFKSLGRSGKSSRRVQGNNMLVAQIALEGDSAFYVAHGRNLSRSMQYALTVMGAASAIYQRDVNVTLQVPYIRIWTGGDPYPGSTSSTLLSQFRSYWNSNMSGVNRTLAQLFSTSSIGGGIAYVNVLCSSSTGYAVIGLNNNVTYPTTAYVWDTDVTAHETGHNFGSPHTHSCNWAPAIDSCYTAEGGCFSSTRPRVGTIMSYCHLTQFGTQLYMHPRVSELVRSKAEQASCISALENSSTNDVAVSTINMPVPGGRLATSSSFTPSATFKNIGTASQSSLAVTFTIRDSSGAQVYSNSQTIASLAAGAYTTVSFLQTSISTAARYSATATITLASDAFPANNTMVRPFETVGSASGTLTLLAPNAATAFRAGAVTPISWSFSGSISSVRIDFSADDGASWSTVATNLAPSAGSFNWTVPPVATSNGRLRISDRDNSATGDINDAAFSILTLPLGWQWARSAGGPGEDEVRAVALDTRGNLLVAGSFVDSIRLGSTVLTAVGGTDAFLAKYSPGGSLLWAQRIAGSGNDSALAVAVDASNNVIVGGGFFSTVSFGSTSLTSAGDQDLFVAKYDADGTLLWAQKSGGSARDQARAVAADASGNAVVTGLFNGTATFGSTNLSSGGSSDMFVAKYAAASGAVQWAQKGGGSGTDQGTGVAVDGSGYVYVSGTFNGTATVAGTALTSAGGADGFIGKYNSSGTGQWGGSWGGTGSDEGRGVTADAAGNAYVVGTISDIVQYGTVYVGSAGGRDIAIAKYNAAGTVQWVRTVASSDDDIPAGIVSDGSGNLYVSGHFQGTIRAGNLSATSAGSTDVMMAKLSSDGNFAWLRNGGGTRAEEAYGITVNGNGDHGFVGGKFSYGSPSDPPSVFGTDSLRGLGGNDAMMMRIGMFKVTSPREGDSWAPGSSRNITWSISGPTNVKIEYSTNSGANWSTISASTANDGTHAWTLPTTSATQVMVRVSDADNGGLYGQAVSGTFAIGGIAPPTNVVAVSYNAAAHLTWTGSTSDGITGYALYRGTTADNMARIATVAAGVRIYRDSSVSNCTDYVYGLKSLAGSAESSMSNTANARPSAPGTLAVTAPAANERVTANSSRTISWSWTGCFSEAKIEYSINNGSSWTSIADQTANDGSYTWQVPNISSTRALVRISDQQNAAVIDVSDTFSICNIPSTIAISGSLAFCEGGSTLLSAPAGYASYLWSNGATTREITVNQAGNYSVTVTDAGGCSGASAVVNVVRNARPQPTISAGGPTTFCQGENVTLSAPAGFANYLWSNGATTRAITVANAGLYSVTVTDANGCSGTSAATAVTVHANPTATIAANGPTTFCQGESVVLSAPAGYTSYRWSNGATTREITVTTAGSYTVTVTNGSGCSATSSATAVTVNTTPTPTISASGPTTFCQGESVTLSAPAGYSSYRWSNGATTREITVTATGSFTVTATGSNGCSATSAATAVTVNAVPNPTITASGPTSFCEGGSVVLSAPAGFASYRWSNGATTREITVTTTGNFAVTVTDANGCSGTSAATAVTVNTVLVPTITADGPTTFCQGEDVVLSAPAGYSTYRWSNGATTREITVTASGSFTVTVSDGNGCSGTSAATAVVVTARPTPSITANGPTTFCQGESLTLSAPEGFASYRWSNGATTREITVTATGSFTVTVTDANGCSGTSAATAVTVNSRPTPTITANGPTSICQGETVTLSAPTGYSSYRWSNGATTREITVGQSGNFTVAVRNSDGCEGISSATTVTVHTMPNPSITANGPTTFCQGESVVLSAPAGFASYRWSNGATTREITVAQSGTFTVTVTNSESCIGTSPAIAVTVNAKPTPTITANGPTSFCQGESVTLSAPAGFASYRWSNGATTREITVTQSASLTVSVTDANGCTGTSVPMAIVAYTQPVPTISADGPTSFCEGGSVVLSAPAGFSSYRWSNGATTREITVTQSGNFTVSVIDANGCSGISAATAVTVNLRPTPTITASGPTTFCQGESVTLSAPAGFSGYRWSNGATTREITVTASGSFTVTVTDANGCSGISAATTVTVNQKPTPTITANGPTTFCEGGSVVLSAPAGFASYRWSNGATTREITVTTTGTFTVSVTDASGCSGISAATAVTVNRMLVPTISASGPTTFCQGGNVTLSAPTGYSTYRWSNGATTREITVTASGNFTVSVSDGNGCEGTSAATTVTVNAAPVATIAASGPTTFCQGESVTLSAPEGFASYHWSNGATTREITVTQSGSFTVTVTDANGCSGTSAATAVVVNATPTPTISASGPTTFCQGESVTLSAPTGFASYRWSNGATTREITVTTPGSFTVSVTDANGCTGVSTATAVTVHTKPTPTIAASGPTTFCQGESVTLSAPEGFASYRWSNGATTREITVTATGNFTVTVTNANGCSGTSAATAVTVNAKPTPTIAAGGPTSFCEGESVILSAPAGYDAYRWSNGATTREITVTTSGNFTVTVTNADGCSGTSAATAVTVHTRPVPTITANGPTTFCEGEDVVLSAPAGFASYRWSNGATTREITVRQSSNLTVTVTDANGCSGTSVPMVVVAYQKPAPTISASGPTTFCEGGNVTLSAPAGFSSYRWSNGATTREITVAQSGSFSVTVSNDNGCSGIAPEVVVTMNRNPAPTIAADGPTTFCQGEDVVLSAPAGYSSYRWSNGATTREITVATTGNFTVTVTNASGCSGTSAPVQVTVHSLPRPAITAAGPTSFCEGESVVLSAPTGYSSYRWSNGATTQEITVTRSGSFTVTVTNANACSGTSEAIEVNVHARPQPTVTAGGPTTFCEGGSVVLSAPAGHATYRWSNGATTQQITVTQSGNYSVAVADDNGCSGSSAAIAVTVNPKPMPTISASGPTTFCQGERVTLSAPEGFTSYRWSNGATTREITIEQSGHYFVTVSNASGCSNASSPMVVVVNPKPEATIAANGPTSFCQGESVTLSAPAGFASYRWSNGATTREITVDRSGEYSVMVTDANGCSGTSRGMAVTVFNRPQPIIIADGPTTFCEGGDVLLSAPTGFASYRWSNGATTRQITVNASGSYSVTVSDANGCDGTSAPTVVTINERPRPTIAAGGPTTFCQGESVTLTAPAGFAGYRWSNGATTRQIVASQSGEYSVTVVDANGCDGTSAATAVTVNATPTPAIAANGPTTICEDGSVELSAPEGFASYRWSNGATSRVISVSDAGNYSVTVVDSNGCSGTSQPVKISVNPLPKPVITRLGPASVCDGESVKLQAPVGFMAYLWSNGATSREITVSATGSYSVTVTDLNGCSGTSEEVSVTVNRKPTPVITANGPASLCDGGRITLIAPEGFADYRWSNGAASRQIEVTEPGDYTVTVTNVHGCSGTSEAFAVRRNQKPMPTISASDLTNFCEGGSVTLRAPAGFAEYLWSNGATSREIVVTRSGNYTVEVTDSNGCSGISPQMTVTVNPKPAPMITANGPTSICHGESVTLSAPTGFASYLWSNGATTPQIVVSQSGIYSVKVTTASGCSGTSNQVPVMVNDRLLPIIGSNGPLTFHKGGQVTLSAPEGYAGYRWSNGATARQITVKNSGTFTVTVFNSNGCSGTSDPVTVTVAPRSQPFITVNGPTKLCPHETVTLFAPEGYRSYLWSNGERTRSIIVEREGLYSVRTIDDEGVEGVSDTTEIVAAPAPTKPDVIRKGNGSVLVSSIEAVAYRWYRNNEPLEDGTERTYNATLNGMYSVQVFGDGGCDSQSEPVRVTVGTTSGITGLRSNTGTAIAVQPNPAAESFTVELHAAVSGQVRLTLADMAGRTVLELTDSHEGTGYRRKVDITTVSSGIYLLEIRNGNEVWTHKVVVKQ